MALADFEYGDPANVVYLQQLQEIKRRAGCVACTRRDRQVGVVFGKAVCGAGHKPHGGGWCTNWQHDEGVGNAASSSV